jgi:hypothetical protein
VANLTDTGENRALDWLFGNTVTAPVLPLQLALTTTVPTDSAAGTEVAGGSYARQDITVGANAASGALSNTADIVFDNMPTVGGSGVRGFEVWDSAGTPVRWWHGTPTVERTTVAGDDYKVAAGDLDFTMA